MFRNLMQSVIILLACSVSSCIAHDEGIKVYRAKISPITGSNSEVSGEVVVFVPPENMFNGFIGYGGYLSNLQPNRKASKCTAKNGCGVHIHNGKSCDNNDTQGGHYFFYSSLRDPWLDQKYSSDPSGKAVISSIVSIETNILNDFPVIVHDEQGSRIGCGILEEIDPFELYSTEIEPIFNSGVHGQVIMYQKSIETSSSQQFPVCYYGTSSGLEPNMDCGTDDVPSACETHVHSGTSCESFKDQGEAYYNSLIVNGNPWKNQRFLKTDEEGNSQFMHCVHTGASDYEEKVFILHDREGNRAACGQLLKLTNRAKPKSIYTAWILVALLIPGMVLPFYVRHEENSKCVCRTSQSKK